MIKMIWCEDLNHGIGLNNKLPWSIKEEMAHFRATTLNNVIVMGRKTFSSIGFALKNRTNIVLTNNHDLKFDNVLIYHSVDDILKDFSHQDIYIIGGVSVYQEFLPFADELIISTLKSSYACDTFLNINYDDFNNFKTIEHELFTIKYYQRRK